MMGMMKIRTKRIGAVLAIAIAIALTAVGIGVMAPRAVRAMQRRHLIFRGRGWR